LKGVQKKTGAKTPFPEEEDWVHHVRQTSKQGKASTFRDEGEKRGELKRVGGERKKKRGRLSVTAQKGLVRFLWTSWGEEKEKDSSFITGREGQSLLPRKKKLPLILTKRILSS